MKKIIILVTAILFSVTSMKLYAYCEGIPLEERKIDIPSGYSQTEAWNEVRNRFLAYTRYVSNGRYELCFSFPGEPLDIALDPQVLTFGEDPSSSPIREVVIQGLRLKKDGNFSNHLLTISYDFAKVILDDLEITNASNGLKIEKSKVELINSNISGVKSNGEGACVDLIDADFSVLKNNKITGCDTGIHIESNDVLIGAENAENYYGEKNEITGNDIGIHVVSGDRNRFGYNEIRDNGTHPYILKQAVTIEGGQNEGIVLPDLIKFDDGEGKKVTFRCEVDRTGKVIKRIAILREDTGSVQVYSYEGDEYSQPEEFLTSCNLSTEGECDLTALSEWEKIGENKCGVPDDSTVKIAVIYTDTSSSEFVDIIPDGIVVFSQGGIVQPTVPEATDDGRVVIIGSGVSGEGGGVEITSIGAAGGCGSSGASIIPNDVASTTVPLSALWWIIFSTGLLAAVRRKKS